MPGQGEIVLGPSSEITLARKELDLGRGAVWVNARLARGTEMRVRTPVVTAGVRGTKFSVLSDTDGAAVCTCIGEVDATLLDSRVVRSPTARFLPVAADGTSPPKARSDRHLLVRPRGDRYDWCFTCHEIGGRGALKRNWEIH